MMMQRRKDESGQILFLFAVSFTVIMMFVMLMVDFGGAALTYHRAQVATDAAAYAAAQAVNLESFYAENAVVLDTGAAAAYAENFAAENSAGRLTLTGLYVQDDRVWVTGVMEYQTMFAHVIGLPVIRTRVVSSAAPAYGIDQPGQ